MTASVSAKFGIERLEKSSSRNLTGKGSMPPGHLSASCMSACSAWLTKRLVRGLRLWSMSLTVTKRATGSCPMRAMSTWRGWSYIARAVSNPRHRIFSERTPRTDE